jgi:predicted ATPase/DNA-binding SARP family transcriptional activator
MSHLAVYMLGSMQVTVDGEPVTRFRGDTVQALLAYLAMHPGTAFRREVLAGLLWPDHPESEALVNLRQVLRRLRTAIGDDEANPPFLIATRTTLAFATESDPSTSDAPSEWPSPRSGQAYWFDVAAFDAALSETRSHAHGRLEGCASCMLRLGEAVDLYRGDFLQGFSLDSALFEEWMVVERERLHGQALEALGHLAAHYEESGQYEQAIAYARRQVELEPWRESAHRQWMRALALSGQRGAALAQYEACRRILGEELGIEPEPETTALYERIRSGGELAVGVAQPPHNLPAQLTPFIGREDLMAEIAERLADPACRLLTLVGSGGSGKTRLALEAAVQQLERFADGVFFVSLAPLRAVEAIVPAIAQALSFRFYGEGEPRQQLLSYLRRKEMLLVLDNYEHLLEGASVATGILGMAPGVKVLATSRARLNVVSECLYPIRGMNYPAMLPQGAIDIGPYGAIELFLSGARRVRPGYEPTGEELVHVAEICQLVEGMPLALLLAAAWMEMLTPAEIARELTPETGTPVRGRGIDFLEADLRDAPERQRSMRAVFDHSWSLLPEGQQVIMQALSVFRGGCTREAAQEVAGASLRDLMALVDRSLLQRTAGPSTSHADVLALRTGGRYEIHELLRQYAAEKLDRSPGAREAARNGHCGHYAAALARWAADLKGPQQQAVLAEIEADIQNSRAAWEWAVDRRQVERLEQAMEGLGLFYERRVRYGEGEAAFRAAAEELAELAKGSPEPSAGLLSAWVKVTTWQGHFSRQLGQIERARELLAQSLALLGDPAPAGHDTRPEKAFALRTMGDIAYWSGDRQHSREPYAESLALYRALGERWEMAEVLTALGAVSQSQGDFDQAVQLHREALAVRRALGDQRGIADSLGEVAWALQSRGQFDEAERLERESLALIRETGDRFHLRWALWGLANPLYWQGKFAESGSLLEESLVTRRDLTPHRPVALAHMLLGGVNLHLGQYEEACVYLHQSLPLAREINFRWGIAAACFHLGLLALAGEQHTEARRWLQESLAIWRESGQRSDVGWALAALGGVARGLGELAQARDQLCQALEVASALRDTFTPLYALPVAALLLADMGKTERAVEIYALASRYGFVAHSRVWEDIAGRRIASLAATLPPDMVAAAQARGRARDLWATVEELMAELEEGS